MSDEEFLDIPLFLRRAENVTEKEKRESGLASCSTAEPSIDWMIWFEDIDRPHEVYSNEDVARKRFTIAGDSWTCHLFKRIESR